MKLFYNTTKLLLVLICLNSCQMHKKSDENPDRKTEELESVLDKKVTIQKNVDEILFVERRDKDYDSKYIIIDDSVSIYVIEKGKGIPLILVNGGPGNSSHSLIPYFDEATKFAKVVFYDPRGVGKSDWKPGEGYSTKQVVNDLEKIRKKLGIDTWVMAGWSYGGLAAQHYALQYSENLLGMVLINSAYSANYNLSNDSIPNHLSEKERANIKDIYSINGSKVVPTHSDKVSLKLMQKMVYNGYLNGDWKRQFFYRPSDEEMACVALYEWVHDKDYNQLVAKDGYSRDMTGLLKNLSIPILMFYGKHDMTFNLGLPYKLKDEFNNATLVMMQNSSHNSFKEEPELFFTELKAFILNLDSWDQK